MVDQQKQPESKKNYYGKRPLWQWVLLYVVVGAVVYGLIYYVFFAGNGGNGGYTY